MRAYKTHPHTPTNTGTFVKHTTHEDIQYWDTYIHTDKYINTCSHIGYRYMHTVKTHYKSLSEIFLQIFPCSSKQPTPYFQTFVLGQYCSMIPRQVDPRHFSLRLLSFSLLSLEVLAYCHPAVTYAFLSNWLFSIVCTLLLGCCLFLPLCYCLLSLPWPLHFLFLSFLRLFSFSAFLKPECLFIVTPWPMQQWKRNPPNGHRAYLPLVKIFLKKTNPKAFSKEPQFVCKK